MFEIPAGARHLLIQEADATSHHLCESEPKCLNSCETPFFRESEYQRSEQSTQAQRLGLCGQVLRSTALDGHVFISPSPPGPVHFLGFHTCIFLGRSELEIRGFL